MIQHLKGAYPVRQVCATLDCPVSTAYSERSALPLAMQWRGGWGVRKEFLTDR